MLLWCATAATATNIWMHLHFFFIWVRLLSPLLTCFNTDGPKAQQVVVIFIVSGALLRAVSQRG